MSDCDHLKCVKKKKNKNKSLVVKVIWEFPTIIS